MKNKIEKNILISELIYSELEKKLSGDEEELLKSWMGNEKNEQFFLSLKNSDRLYEGMLKQQYMDMEASYRKLQRKIGKKKQLHLWIWLSGVAALLIIGVGLSLFIELERPGGEIQQLETVLPLSDRTVLQTTGGETMYIADSVKCMIPVMKGTKRSAPVKAVVATNVKYNVLATSSRGRIEMLLSDSSRVWLNSGSELRYPDVFDKDRRTVYLDGEAYFKVARDSQRPFIVNIGSTEVMVLGTEFNVRVMGTDACQTTLVEGKVQLYTPQQQSVVLRPGQQAEVRLDGKIEVREVDVRYQIAWKKNQFAFHDQTLYHILKELSEWYGFNFDFENMRLANLIYTAIVPRYPNVDDVLQILERAGDFRYVKGEDGHISVWEK